MSVICFLKPKVSKQSQHSLTFLLIFYSSAEANVLFSGKPYSDNSSFKEPMEFVENFTDTTNVTLKRIHETSFIKYVDESRTLNDARASGIFRFNTTEHVLNIISSSLLH